MVSGVRIANTAHMFDQLLAANAAYAEGFAFGDLPRTPARHLAVVTCMDARIDALAVLGLHEGDAHILRNAGGRVSQDVVRSLLVSTRLLGVSTVGVMHHTDCGMASVDRHELRELVNDVDDEDWESLDLLTIDDRTQALRDDVEQVRTSALLPQLDVAGLLYDVATGRVSRLI